MDEKSVNKENPKNKKLSNALVILLLVGISLYAGFKISERTVPAYFHPTGEKPLTLDDYLSVLGPQPLYYKETTAGNYLSGQFAQNRKDWEKAADYFDKILLKGTGDVDLKKQAMVLSMGAGKTNRAIALAREVNSETENNVLATLFIIMDAFERQDYEQGLKTLETVPPKSLGSFITPVLNAWARSSDGTFEIGDMPLNSLYAYHALLIGQFTGHVDDAVPYVERSLKSADIDPHDLEKIADLYAHIGEKEKALKLYALIQDNGFSYGPLKEKISKLENGESIADLIHIPDVQSPKDGAALVFLNMAEILYRDQSDDSALVFANMAEHLSPKLPKVNIIIGSILARNEQPEKAIENFLSVGKKDRFYKEAQRQAAGLYEETDQPEKAIDILEGLFDQDHDIEALIQIGHLHRRAENYNEAIKYYNKAAKEIGDNITEEYWPLLYARGMAYEQIKKYEKSEEDLLTALKFQPNHPYILNYLGYSWADQGRNLDQSLDMIKRAVALKPDDGYIADSLGWVLFRMNEFEKAVPHLERAIELQPYDPVINDHLGDVYWLTGRLIEARFQWDRAYNHTDEEELKISIQDKMTNGLDMPAMVSNDNQIAETPTEQTLPATE